MNIKEIKSHKLFYTTHHCWSWILNDAVRMLSADSVKCSRWKDLPSVSSSEIALSSGAYALFRVEIDKKGVWCTSKVFEFLDAKDALYRHLPHVMPDTLLLPWDCYTSKEVEIQELISNFIVKNGSTALLKAALGSGGHGLYFVGSDPTDTLSVIRGHARKALAAEGFVDKLRSQYEGEVPRWSLQALLSPVLVGPAPGRRSQVRVYLVMLESTKRCYMYKNAEVRLPCWDKLQEFVDLDTEYEQEVCAGGNAIPYNQGRLRKDTERYLLQEVLELQGAQTVVLDCIRSAFISLQASLVLRCPHIPEAVPGERELVAVLGADLLVVTGASPMGSFCSYILEVNNNPAMANPDKHKMSPLYRKHCVDFCHDLLQLGLSGGREAGGFDAVF